MKLIKLRNRIIVYWYKKKIHNMKRNLVKKMWIKLNYVKALYPQKQQNLWFKVKQRYMWTKMYQSKIKYLNLMGKDQ